MTALSGEIRDLVLGALLHDIGKFKQRAALDEDEGKSHIEIGHSWLVTEYGEGLIAAGARNHHAKVGETWDSNLSMIFYEADNCAASERKPYDSAESRCDASPVGKVHRRLYGELLESTGS